ncbi:hypothetical protein I553_1038 [Mycobacterium xenopi 4042]|uniref:Uncharacterized protein n=1 Tax=Mycobacterium xenopi 4042 TaxID=1299334 RepID=X7ZBA9_MYCXE|nr:hypothetical protein I553_1038 [Mycobacterium xenopi 4042]
MALAASADTITAAVSARRSNTLTGNNSCVTPHPVHRDRRGHSPPAIRAAQLPLSSPPRPASTPHTTGSSVHRPPACTRLDRHLLLR